MRHSHGVHYALLGVVSQNPEGVHGYALKRQCDRILGTFWQLNFGEIYRALDKLAADGLIEQVEVKEESNRKLYRITAEGRRGLDDFVCAPQTDEPRPLRQELAVKLLFARQDRLGEVLQLVINQRTMYLRQLHLLDAQRRKLERARMDSLVTNLLIDGAELHVRAELAWLEQVSRRLKEQFAT